MEIALDEIEVIGLKLVALLRAGHLNGFKCQTCSKELAIKRNCTGVDKESTPVFYHESVGEFYSCPLKFIPMSVFSFIDRYDYIKGHESSAPSYDDVNPRYWASFRIYESFCEELRNTKDKPSTGDNMSKMAGLFKKD